ncbi:MAG: VRR-NUC domain-containing protein [Rhodocyclaceae bacterium]|nr:MAG: VRR-NUC domain-containing protein [Rhodocyclaceae bacterium]
MNEEHLAAVAFAQWWALTAGRFGVSERLLWAIPNGGKRGFRTAIKMKMEGVQKGAPDYVLMVPRGQFHGLTIELKRPKTHLSKQGTLSDSQKSMMILLREQGYDTAVCYGTDEAIRRIQDYLAIGTKSEFYVGGTK